ncbi:hypothetical protein JIG36_20205 [Actinoplanes sp. LDG1-06]|uniref:TRAM domain-containing protein n=1 Tax=Paractinoplanes ovalisporus TaxID=2810368 RepID=A0ABS2AF60_9ACTN|nr:hypothetical protein [Actinoplanes ovalisporus]MBM2617884.1 hypothetical protein [Actinoplanes ovalisporus]
MEIQVEKPRPSGHAAAASHAGPIRIRSGRPAAQVVADAEFQGGKIRNPGPARYGKLCLQMRKSHKTPLEAGQALTGRVEILEVLPLTQAEIEGSTGGFMPL